MMKPSAPPFVYKGAATAKPMKSAPAKAAPKRPAKRAAKGKGREEEALALLRK